MIIFIPQLLKITEVAQVFEPFLQLRINLDKNGLG
jgi:hypothetical protein